MPLQLGWTEISDTPAWDKRSFEIEITNIPALEPPYFYLDGRLADTVESEAVDP